MDSINNGKLVITVNRLGAELMSIKTMEDDKEFLWQGDSNYWRGHSTILFPIIGGIPDDTYELDGKSYEMKSHGIARGSEFVLVEQTHSSLVYKLTSSEETLKRYPYRFEFFVSYHLNGNTLRHGFKVNNLEEREMLFSVGAHPGFFCPLYVNEKMEDYYLRFEKPEVLERRIKKGNLLSVDKEAFLQGEQEKQLSHSLFYNGAVILDSVTSNWLEIRNKVNSRVIRVEFAGFPYLGIWSAANDGPFVCIEPWYGIDSTTGDSYDFRKKEGLQALAPKGQFACEYTITLE